MTQYTNPRRLAPSVSNSTLSQRLRLKVWRRRYWFFKNAAFALNYGVSGGEMLLRIDAAKVDTQKIMDHFSSRFPDLRKYFAEAQT